MEVLQISNPEYVFYTRITLYTNASYNNYGKCVIPVGGISYILGSKLSQVNVSGFSLTTTSYYPILHGLTQAIQVV